MAERRREEWKSRTVVGLHTVHWVPVACYGQEAYPICPYPELISLKPWLELFPANNVKYAFVPGELLFMIFLELKGVMLGSQDHLSKTNKQAVVMFYFCLNHNFEL